MDRFVIANEINEVNGQGIQTLTPANAKKCCVSSLFIN